MKKKIAIIEQDQDISDIISYILADFGYEPYCLTGIDGLAEIAIGKPDLVILNDRLLTSPEENIVEVIRLPDGVNTPVMIISDKPDSALKKMSIRADELLPMPFDLDDLIGKVRRLLT